MSAPSKSDPRGIVCSVLVLVALGIAGCQSTPPNPNSLALEAPQLAHVDLPRYMGRWYNIANIPYFGEKGYVASYSEWTLRPDGAIDDLYVGRKGGFDEPETRREFVDSVVPGSGNAHWRVRLFWPIYVSQLTLYVDPDYQYTILGYPDKSLGWIFARSPDMSGSRYAELLERLETMGYDTTRFRRVPQHPDQLGKPGFQSPGFD